MMMKRSISLVTALCLLSLCACAAPGGRAVSPASADGEMGSSVSFTDSLGSTITLEEAPQRVAALIGSYAETWVLAGGEDTLAAVTQDAYDERGLELGEDVTNVGSRLPIWTASWRWRSPWLRPAFPPLGSRWSPSPTTSPCWRSAPV